MASLYVNAVYSSFRRTHKDGVFSQGGAKIMGLESTMTEQDMDIGAQQFVQGLRSSDAEPDLAVDGLSESFLARLIRIFTFRRS